MSTTSSQRPNLRPTSRSVPMISKPSDSCRRTEDSWPADDPGEHGVEAVGPAHVDQLGEQQAADPLALVVAVDVDESSTLVA